MKHSNANTKARTPFVILAATALTVLLAACSEKPQTAGTTHSSAEHKAWSGGQKSFNTAGWTPGDKASWEAQIKQRNRSQNEYVRMGQ